MRARVCACECAYVHVCACWLVWCVYVYVMCHMRGGDDDDECDECDAAVGCLCFVCLVRAARVCDVWCVCASFVAVLAVLVAGDDATRRSWMTVCKCRGVVALCCCWRCECVGLSWVEFV